MLTRTPSPRSIGAPLLNLIFIIIFDNILY